MKTIDSKNELTKQIELLTKVVAEQQKQIAEALTARVPAKVPSFSIEGLNKKETERLALSLKRAMRKAKYKNYELKPESVVNGTSVKPAKVKQLRKDGTYSEFEVKSKRAIIGIYDKDSGSKIRESVWHV